MSAEVTFRWRSYGDDGGQLKTPEHAALTINALTLDDPWVRLTAPGRHNMWLQILRDGDGDRYAVELGESGVVLGVGMLGGGEEFVLFGQQGFRLTVLARECLSFDDAVTATRRWLADELTLEQGEFALRRLDLPGTQRVPGQMKRK